jgi:hypothetical protein
MLQAPPASEALFAGRIGNMKCLRVAQQGDGDRERSGGGFHALLLGADGVKSHVKN